jgi:S-phase kinase-associated protein 1
MVKITTNDGHEFNIESAMASQSVLIKNMLEDLGDEDDTSIPLPNVTKEIFEKGNEKTKERKTCNSHINLSVI